MDLSTLTDLIETTTFFSDFNYDRCFWSRRELVSVLSLAHSYLVKIHDEKGKTKNIKMALFYLTKTIGIEQTKK